MRLSRPRQGEPERGDLSDRVREYVREHYLEPARTRGELAVRVVTGDVHRALGLSGRAPSVCNALKTRNFLEENGLSLEKVEGPPSGQSTTVIYTYSFTPGTTKVAHPFWELRGVCKDIFREFGGGEAFLSAERQAFILNEHGPKESSE